MKQLILVFIGGGFGSALRFLIGKWLNSSETGIPYGTFATNILGSLLIGIILGVAAKNDSLTQNQTLLLATGFCGGFTTFSTFAYENHVFLKSGDFMHFAIYTIASFIVGFLAVFLGMYLAK
ncbi:MAG: fluoride efflux transporter CrcB [Winogradskyella sp.]